MSAMERAGRFFGRLSAKANRLFFRPAHARCADAINSAPYHVKYNSAVLLTALYLVAIWAFHVVGMAWLITHFIDVSLWVVAALYFPVFAYLNRFAEQENKLPELRRLLGLRLLRKH